MGTPDLDAVVLGANIRGLVTAYVLSSLGYRAAIIERGPRIGGADGSFLTPGGTRFEIGMHVLDEMRSEAATRLFAHVLDGQFHRVLLRRGIALRGQVMPYAPKPEQMPEALRALLPSRELVDSLGDAPPTRANLAQYYGRAFTDLIFDEVLPSFPSENRHRKFGVDESLLLTNIYPWFFPRVRRSAKPGDESRAFHDLLRAGTDQYILYPRSGGFGSFAEALAGKLDRSRIEIVTGASDVRLEVEPGAHTVKWVEAQGRRFQARRYFWGGPWEALSRILKLPCQEIGTDRVLLGSFVFNHPARTEFHEILVGDPSLSINRVYFPARFRESGEPLMQIEFAVPKAEDRPLDADYWKRKWLEDCRRLGLLGGDHQVVEFDFKSVFIHFNGYGMEGEALRDADPGLLHADANIHPVVPSMANLNLNRYIPRALAYVTSVLSGT